MCESKLEAQASHDKILSIVGAIPDIISVISLNLDVLFVNKGFGNSSKVKNIIEYLGESKYHRRYTTFTNQTNEILQDIKTAFALKLENEISFGITLSNNELVEWKGKLIVWDYSLSIMLFGRSVTNLLKLQKESSESEYKSALLHTVSHEMRTPTNAILAMTQMIKSSFGLSKENIERLDVISASCAYQLCLINDLLDFAQIIAGCLKITKVPFNIFQLLSECIGLIDIQIKERNVKFQLKILEISEKLISDPHRLKQVILNLLSNAKKFTLSGSIILEVDYSNSMLHIRCIDTGIGIPPDKLSVLFTQFGRINDSSSINPQGVGLGLLISNMLVKELGGDGIHIESEVGKGSCFSFSIKTEEARSSEMDIAQENVKIVIPSIFTKSLLNKIEILIVDDIYFNIMAYIQILKTEGINCGYALSGEEALTKIKEKQYACILMDCEMPMMDGWETTKRIKQMKINKEILYSPAIIACSAHNLEIIQQKCTDAGMNDIIIKPCAREFIIAKVKYWIENYKDPLSE